MLLNWLLGYKMLHMSQFFLRHGKFPRSFSPSDFSFDRISLSRRDFGLRNTTCGGFGSTDFNKGDFSMWRWADFKISKITCKTGWNVSINVTLRSMEFTFRISGLTTSALLPLSIN